MRKWKQLVIGGVTAAALVTGTGTVFAIDGQGHGAGQESADATVKGKRDWTTVGKWGSKGKSRKGWAEGKYGGSGRFKVKWRKGHTSKPGKVKIDGDARDGWCDGKGVALQAGYLVLRGEWVWRQVIVAHDRKCGAPYSYAPIRKARYPVKDVMFRVCFTKHGRIIVKSCGKCVSGQ